jgi:hypothetical protein
MPLIFSHFVDSISVLNVRLFSLYHGSLLKTKNLNTLTALMLKALRCALIENSFYLELLRVWKSNLISTGTSARSRLVSSLL